MPYPQDFAFRFEWNEGSLPPPFHYEWIIEVEAISSGVISYIPDYQGQSTPTWSEKFDLRPAWLEKLFEMLLEIRATRRKWKLRNPGYVGGELEWMNFTALEKHYSIPANLSEKDAGECAPIYQYICQLVPQEIWHKLEKQRQDYINQNSNGET